MEAGKLRVVHYLNQFFGQEGKEEKADMQFLVKNGPVGPGLALQKILGARGEVVSTVICGDNYFAENIEKAAEEGLKLIQPFAPDLFFAGPAFEAGRYGIACGAICKIVQEKLGIPAITGMYAENPGVDLYRSDAYICRTERSAARTLEDLTRMANLGWKLISGEKKSQLVSGENLGDPVEDGYFARRIIRNQYTPKTQAERSVDMLLAKLSGKPFITETEVPKFQPIRPPSPIRDIHSSTITLISDGGITKKGNPDRFSGRGDNGWGAYPMDGFFLPDYSLKDIEIVHTGYSHVHVLANINRLAPVDVLRDLEKEGVIGRLHPFFFSTSGNAASLQCSRQIGREMAQELRNREVDGAILTSTWGSSTRCGATIAAEIERAGVPVVNITAVPTVSKMMGVTRILRGASVTNVLGDVNLSPEQEKLLRKKYILRALQILQMEIQGQQMFTLEGTL